MESVQGHSLGYRAFGNDYSVEYEPRQRVGFCCQRCGRNFEIPFSAEAEIPNQWRCAFCGDVGLRIGISPDEHLSNHDEKISGKTPFEMLLERRSREELEAILDERLAYLRARRGTVEFDVP
jgi:hypothetical protein